CDLIVFGAFNAANERLKTARNDEDNSVGWPVIGWRQFTSVLHADAPGGAGTDVDDASSPLDCGHRVFDGDRDRAKRFTYRSGGRKLPLVHGRNHLGHGPGIEVGIAGVDLLGAHHSPFVFLLAAHRARCKAPSTASPSTGTRRRCTSGASQGCIDDASPPSRATRDAPCSERRRTRSSICSAASRTIRRATRSPPPAWPISKASKVASSH